MGKAWNRSKMPVTSQFDLDHGSNPSDKLLGRQRTTLSPSRIMLPGRERHGVSDRTERDDRL